jgi:hypothetical protein
VQINATDTSKHVQIRVALYDKSENALVSFLRNNRDVFAWKPVDMPRIPREITEHALNIQSMA